MRKEVVSRIVAVGILSTAISGTINPLPKDTVGNPTRKTIQEQITLETPDDLFKLIDDPERIVQRNQKATPKFYPVPKERPVAPQKPALDFGPKPIASPLHSDEALRYVTQKGKNIKKA